MTTLLSYFLLSELLLGSLLLLSLSLLALPELLSVLLPVLPWSIVLLPCDDEPPR